MPKQAVPTSQLFELAQADPQLAGIFADLRHSDLQANGPGSVPQQLSPEQAFFAGWYLLRQRPGGKEAMALAGLPTTKSGMADLLGKSRPTLDKWLSSDWMLDSGVDALIDVSLLSLLPAALTRLLRNISDESGGVSNQAIKITMDLLDKQRAARSPEAQFAAMLQNLSRNLDLETLDDDQLDAIASGEIPLAIIAA